MNRRQVLQVAAVLPVTGLLLESLPAVASVAPVSSAPRVLTFMEMADQLWVNQEACLASMKQKAFAEDPTAQMNWDDSDLRFLRAVCVRFCMYLSDFSLSQPYMPDQDSAQFNNMRFEVFDGAPVGVFSLPNTYPDIVLTALTRRMKGIYNVEAYQDLHAFHGIDVELEISTCLGQQSALEIQIEIRKDTGTNGRVPRLYAFYTPPMPHLYVSSETEGLGADDWSRCRRLSLRYAKYL